MRGEFFKHKNIIISVVFSTVLVVGAYLFARGVEAPQVAQASTETALLQAIASKDSDADGLTDWLEALYGTDSHNSDTFHLGMTDGEAVTKGLIVPKAISDIPTSTSSSDGSVVVDPSLPPAPADGTLTAQFAQNFFTLFIAAKEANGGADLSESQMNDVANQSIQMLTTTVKAAPDYKNIGELAISESSAGAMTSFAANAEAVLLKNTNDATTTDINYFKSALIDGDANANGHILSIAKGLRDSAVGLAVLPVPKELAQADLLLINILMRLSQVDVDFTKAGTDPLVAILALQQYQTVTTALGKAFIDIGNIYASAGISLPSGAPGARFVNMTANIQDKQAATKTP